MAAQIATVAESGNSVKQIAWTWTSATAGTVTLATTKYYDGKIIGFVTNPGSTAPTTLYDVVINDGNSTDVLFAAGDDRSATVTEQVMDQALLGVVANSKLTLVITNAGAVKDGVTYLYIR